MTDGEDWDLLQLYTREGSPSAFAQLAAKYARFVHAIAYRRTRDPHLAEDVTQAVFIVLARRAETLPRAVSIAGWLHRTTVYTAVSAMRSENRRRHHEHQLAVRGHAKRNGRPISITRRFLSERHPRGQGRHCAGADRQGSQRQWQLCAGEWR